jgi:uncharacterized protein YcfJ
MNRAVVRVVAIGLLSAGIIGCQSNAGNGALIGAGVGAGTGAIIGHQSGKTGQGALIGGAVGAVGGALVGNEMDKNQAREREQARDREYRQNSTAYRETSYQSRSVTQADVISWTRRGDRDDLIIDRIEQSGTVFNLSSRDENKLRDAGVSEEVIRAMRDTARR